MPGKPIPFGFVLELLASRRPVTRPMFGCTAVYVNDRIVFILRLKEGAYEQDNGVWMATHTEHHPSLKLAFPSMRSISLFGPSTTAWQNLPMDAPDFEEMVTRACEMVVMGDTRIGKVPGEKRVPRGEAPRHSPKKKSKPRKKKKPTKKRVAKK